MSQLALPFSIPPSYGDADFCAAPSNEAARDWLARPDAWPLGRLVLWGAPGCGKTHLLHIWARAHKAEIIPMAALPGWPHPGGPVCIDDADTIPDPACLLHLLNTAAEQKTLVLMAASTAPARMDYTLPDLTSRLRATQSVQILPPEDELLAMLLARLLAERQLRLNAQIRQMLLTRLPRTSAALREAVARLDAASLDGARKLTRATARGILSDML
ncbi:MAG: DnaA/Hda family protein [Acidocella sp.]|nr:DnaA/Hda family protein [Acidocella sp.]